RTAGRRRLHRPGAGQIYTDCSHGGAWMGKNALSHSPTRAAPRTAVRPSGPTPRTLPPHPMPSSHPTTRRQLVVVGGSLAPGVALTTPAHARLLPRTRGIGRGRFLDGVASGEPGPEAVTFWGRLRTSRPRSAARLVVAADEGLTRTVATVV